VIPVEKADQVSMNYRSIASGVVTLTLLGSPLGAWAQKPPPDAPSAAVPPAPPAASAPQAGATSGAPEAPLTARPLPGVGPSPYPYRYPYPYTAEPAQLSVRYWYGWQTLTVMGGSTLISVISAAFAAKDGGGNAHLEITIPLAISGFMLGGPIVHWAHGNIGKGFISFGMNVGGPLLVGATAAAATCATGACRGMFGGLAAILPGFIGGGIGLLAANIVDVTVLSYDERRPPRATPVVGWRPISLVPTLELGKERMALGLKGIF
jgi:hypothetical protein